MRLMVASVMVLVAVSAAHADEINDCQDLIPKDAKLVFSRAETIPGDMIRCYVRPSEGGEESFQGIVHVVATSRMDEELGCYVNEPFLFQLWELNLDARHAQALSYHEKQLAAKKVKASDKPVSLAQWTFAVAAVFDEQCRHLKNVQGVFESSGPHAEQRVIQKLIADQDLKPGYSLAWMIDQQPCQDGTTPKEGYCTVALKAFARSQNVGNRVFMMVGLKPDNTKDAQSPKTLAVNAHATRGTDKAPKLTKHNIMELHEFRVKPKKTSAKK